MNFEHAFLPQWRAKVGLGSDFMVNYFFAPIGIHYLSGRKAHHLDLSAGGYLAMSWYKNSEGTYYNSGIAPYLATGYRYQNKAQPLFFSIQPTVVFLPVAVPFLTLGIGWTF